MNPRVLIIEDNPDDALIYERLLEKDGYSVEIVTNKAAGLARALSGEFDVVLTDLNLGGPRHDEGRDLVAQLHVAQPHLPVILMTGGHKVEMAIEVIRVGAFDYFPKPSNPFQESFRADLAEMLDKAAASKKLMEKVKLPGDTSTEGKPTIDQIIGHSRVMQNVYKEIGRVADKPVTVLIRGETGTGKELVARAIYTHSDRANKPFIVVNCAAIPESLLESELFGYEAGAFTGAKARRLGRFELAHQGTLFLDEIGDMNLNLQQKLLRVLQEQVIERVGGTESVPIDVRVLAATHRDLELGVQEGEFRQDLYFRLNVAMIHLPRLRERQEDLRDLITRDAVTGNESRIPGLVNYFTERYAGEFGSATPPVTEEAFQELERYQWPGNVRELRNVIRKALLLARGYAIDPKVIQSALAQMVPPRPAVNQTFAEFASEFLARAKSGELENLQEGLTETVERELYAQAIQRAKGDQSKAARWLGVSRPTMLEKLRRFDLHPTRT
jgi:DNA-binding NtrC family response regulator